MHGKLLIDKLHKENHRAIKFLEEYYSDRIGKRTKISFDVTAQTSYFDAVDSRIVISYFNLNEVIKQDKDLLRPMFYTILLHEIGHAIYTGGIPFSMMANILEDNRLEYQVSKWNTRVNFKLLRYIFQDKNLDPKDTDNSRLKSALALLRTVDNTPYIKELGTTGTRMQIIKEILELNEMYTHMDDELRLYRDPNDPMYVKYNEAIQKASELIDKLMAEPKTEPQPQPKSSASKDQKQDQEQDQKPNIQEQDQEEIQKQKSIQEIKDKLEEDLGQLIQTANEGIGKEDYNTAVLFNPEPDTTPYHKYPVSAFVTKRNAGIKGSRDVTRKSGNAQQLSLKKYMRRDQVQGEKLFSKTMQTYGRGGKSAKAVFYLDVSGSMSGRPIRIATDYLKSFYDTMHKYMDIKLYAFAYETFEITRNELNLPFLEHNLQGATKLKTQKVHNNEEIIVITDGEIDGEIPPEFIKRAHFVVINMDERSFDKLYGHLPNKTRVDSNDIVKGLEEATKGIKRLLS